MERRLRTTIGIYLIGIILDIIAVLGGAEVATAAVEEVCENDIFHAQCALNEVIVVKHAQYGRMRFGGCITGQHGKLGCVTDARPYLDAQCSGRERCDVTVATLIPDSKQPCSKDLRSYLEVLYECVKVVNASRAYCQNSEAVEVSEQSGYLSSLVNIQTGCGSIDSPWWVTVEQGQNITLTLLDFGVTQTQSERAPEPHQTSSVCHVYAVIKEPGDPSKQTQTVCAERERERRVLTSSTNRLEVRLVKGNENSERKELHFLFHFQANGCPDIPKPVKGWVRRNGDDVTISCADNSEEFTLHCEGTKWVGNHRNCSAVLPIYGGSNEQPWNFLHQKHGVSVLIILCIAVTVGLCILAVGLVHIKRRRAHDSAREDYKRRIPGEAPSYGQSPGGPGGADKPILPPPPSRTYNTKTGDSTEFYHSENDYYRTWQMQRHAPQHHHHNQQPQHQGSTPRPPLPPPTSGMPQGPPPPLFTTQRSTCSTHSSSGGYQRSTQAANCEHIYESPKFDRKDYASSDDYELDGINAEYFELDPDSNNK